VTQAVADRRLALLGGTPLFDEALHVGRPNIGDRVALLARLNDVLDRRWLTNKGPYVEEFEGRIARLSGVKHCIATANGAVGLEIGIRALGLSGDVIVPSFTFVATAHALEWQGLRPVFADVDPATHMVTPATLDACVTSRTTGVIGVHLWGQVAAARSLEAWAAARRLPLLFDAAHAFGCESPDGRVGRFGALEVFSFHATKFVNSLEGGAIVTDDDDLARRIRLMKNFGFLGYDNVGYVGTNGKMNEFSAAMGLTSIDAMDEFIAINRSHYDRYRQGLAGLPGLSLLEVGRRERSNFQYVVALVDPATCPVSRDRLLDVLWAENILARRYFYPGCHRMEPYRSRAGRAPAVPHTEAAAERVLVLPTGQSVSPHDVDVVCDVLRRVLTGSPALHAAIQAVPPRHQPAPGGAS
jgi:dTDP-4-amino-4,6-dideoxygalactose transaminase